MLSYFPCLWLEKPPFWPNHATSSHLNRKLLAIFQNLLLKIMHFRHISAERGGGGGGVGAGGGGGGGGELASPKRY